MNVVSINKVIHHLPMRDYQITAVDSVYDGIRNDKLAGYISAPTGSGKSRIIAALAHDFVMGDSPIRAGRVLIIAHRGEIIQQLATEVDKFLPNNVGILQAELDEIENPVIVATIQSLRIKRLERLIAVSNIPIVALIVDETHRISAQSYLTLINRLYTHNPEIVIIGLSATPFRADKKVIQDILPTCYYEVTIPDLQDKGILTPFIYRRIVVPMDIANVMFSRISGDTDFDSELLAQAVNKPIVNKALVRATIPEIDKRKTLVFTAGIAHANMLAEEYASYGIHAVALSGKTPDKERHRILDEWRNGDIQLVCNSDILVEGFDMPHIACIVLARPTVSYVRYMQQLGRGSRVAPRKQNCLILEASPGVPDMRQITLNRVMPIEEQIIPQIRKRKPRNSGMAYLAMVNPKSHHTWKWRYLEQHQTFTIPLNKDSSLWIVRNPDTNGNGLWRIGVFDRRQNRVLRVREMCEDYSQHTAIELASRYLNTHATRKLAQRNAYWQEMPASKRQLDFLSKYAQDVLADIGMELNMGLASEIIDNVISRWNAPKIIRTLWNSEEI